MLAGGTERHTSHGHEHGTTVTRWLGGSTMRWHGWTRSARWRPSCPRSPSAAGYLVREVVEAFHESGLLRILLPTDLGGAGLTIPESVQVFRAMSAYDGSAGWLAGIIGNGPLFGMFLAPCGVRGVFGPPRGRSSPASLNPLGGRAEPVPGGYRFNGRATERKSGCHHADWLMAGAWVHRDGEKSWIDGSSGDDRRAAADGRAPPSRDTWSRPGMRATGSDDCTYVDVVVPAERTFDWPEPLARWDAGPAARIPMHAQLGIGVAATIVGTARGTQQRFVELAATQAPDRQHDRAGRAGVRPDGGRRGRPGW